MITHSTRAAVPVEALNLAEDIASLNEIWRKLDRIQASSVSQDIHTGRKVIRLMQSQIRLAERHASQVLRDEYLAPVRKKIEPKRRHIVR